MAKLIGSDQLNIVVGLGTTGLSCVRYLCARGLPCMVVDSRESPPQLQAMREAFPEVVVDCGPFDPELLKSASRLVVSPGVPLQDPALQAAIHAGVSVCGDIGLFRREATAPVIAITGSNAKSTVTTLVGEMAAAAGRKVGVGGNIGTPALDLLELDDCDLYVLELSSFQLETLQGLDAEVACILNVSPDHMDRYADVQAYHRAKQRIFQGCRQIVVNRQDPLTEALVPATVKRWSFGLDVPDLQQFGVETRDGRQFLVQGQDALLAADEMKMRGAHNVANALAALALGHAVGLEMAPMIDTLRSFAGLPHRCQWVADRDGVTWFNDSKATNVGAALAAIQGLSDGLAGKLVLIAGGDGKGQDFSALTDACRERVRAVVLMGRDADRVEAAVAPAGCTCIRVADMNEAVREAAAHAEPGDVVLLSPACASFDMFQGFADRGDAFVRAVQLLGGGAA